MLINFISEYYRKCKNDISLQFFLTLKKILKDNRYDDYCELIFFEGKFGILLLIIEH